MNDTIQHRGLSFRVEIEHDTSHGTPWDESDGHGPVSDWRADERGNTSKRPGERELCRDRYSARFYDFAEAIRIGKRDGWGLAPEARAKLAATLGREPTAGEIVTAAVEADFDRLRRWCADDWHYVGVVVTLLDIDGEPIESVQDSLWGIESDCDDYHTEVARDCADTIADRIGDVETWSEATRGRSITYHIRA